MFKCAHCGDEYESFFGIICTKCRRGGWCLRCGQGQKLAQYHHCAACHAA